MDWKRIFTISSSILYLILVSLFLYYYKVELTCKGYGHPCLRFCSSDTEKGSDKELFDSLMEDNITKYYDTEFDDVTVFRGPPLCNVKLINMEDVEEDITADYYFDYGGYRIYDDGELVGNGIGYTISKYCMEKNIIDKATTEEDTPLKEWIPMVCSNEISLKQSVFVIMAVISLIILALTLSVYLYFAELRDFHGKMIALFLSSMICTYIIIPGITPNDRSTPMLINLLIGFGFTSGNLWLNSMILNIYFRCRDVRTLKSKDDKFKSYAIYVSTFTTFAVLFANVDLLMLGSRFSGEFASLVHSYLIFCDLVILIITSIIIRNVSKQIDLSEREQLEKEKKLFWIYVKLFAIMSVTWSTQLFALKKEINYFGCLTACLIMLFSAVNVSGLFVGRKKVRNLLYNKYHGTSNEQTEVNI